VISVEKIHRHLRVTVFIGAIGVAPFLPEANCLLEMGVISIDPDKPPPALFFTEGCCANCFCVCWSLLSNCFMRSSSVAAVIYELLLSEGVPEDTVTAERLCTLCS